MYILGYSGLNEARTFKKLKFASLTPQEYRITQGFDAAAALIADGVIIAAAEEERFNGVKHTEKFPVNAINFCLAQAGITISNLDFICHGFDHYPYQSLFARNDYGKEYYSTVLAPDVQYQHFKKFWPDLNIEKKFLAIKHHAAHAASAFYPSGYLESLVLVADGMGEMDSISLFHGRGNQLLPIQQYDLLSSLGMLYSMLTYHLGFSINNSEGKIMGLAAYGDPKRYADFFSDCLSLEPEGEIIIKGFYKNETFLDWETYRGFRHWLAEKTFPSRSPDDPLEQHHKDLAASLQQVLIKALLHLLTYWQHKTGLKKLCYAGGVALNCTANGIILKSGLFDEVYVQPAAGDSGCALGSALYHHHHNLALTGRDKPQRLPFYGSRLNINEYFSQTHNSLTHKKMSREKILEEAAELLTKGQVIAWLQGEMEFGPRALGNRSILADPRDPSMRDKINNIVKKRESFRPFAPSIKREKAHIYFEIEANQSLSSMSFIVPVREQYRKLLPAVTHVDGAARVQTVDKDEHPYYWQLLNKFEEKTGLPILLNTSCNVRGQPIVSTVKEAIEMLTTIDIDALFIEDVLFSKVKNDLLMEI